MAKRKSGDHDTLRVVVCDDMQTVRLILAGLIEDLEHIVVAQCRTGNEAFHACRSLMPDVLIIDYHLPEPNGFETAKKIGRELKNANIGVILTTTLEETKASIDLLHTWLSSPYVDRFLDKEQLTKKNIAAALMEAAKRPQTTRGLATLTQAQDAFIARMKRVHGKDITRREANMIIKDLGDTLNAKNIYQAARMALDFLKTTQEEK